MVSFLKNGKSLFLQHRALLEILIFDHKLGNKNTVSTTSIYV